MTAARRPLIVFTAIVAFAGALAATTAFAGAAETAKKADRAASGVATKAEKAVKRGAKKTGDAIERGVKAANRGADKVGHKLGLPPGSASAAQAAQSQR